MLIGKYLEDVRRHQPLIHNITNYVTANDCANVLLAAGASPIMSDDAAEVEEITRLCQGLNLNIGTLNSHTIAAMHKAGQKAAALHHPIVLDPVGAGASHLRTQTAQGLLQAFPITVVRGNLSELKALAGEAAKTHGVDAAAADKITEDNLEQYAAFARSFAQATHTIIAISGAIDLLTDGDRILRVDNGNPLMAKITGSGCMLSALVAAYLAPAQDLLSAVTAAFAAWGCAGELAAQRLQPSDGNSTYRNYLIDAIYHLTPQLLTQQAKVAAVAL